MRATSFLLFLLSVALLTFVAGAAIVGFLRWRDTWRQRADPKIKPPLVMSIWENAFRYQNMGWAAAISMVLFIIILVITVIQFRLLRTDWEY